MDCRTSGARVLSVRDQFPGYYRPSTEEFKSLWSDALIVPDTNVLLNLYRFSSSAREQLFAILDRVADRLWVPHQVGLEFERNRIGVVLEQRRQYGAVIDEIEKGKASVLRRVRSRSAMDQAQLATKFEQQLAPLIAELEELGKSHPDPIGKDDLLGADSVRDRLAELLAGRVGASSDEPELWKVGAKRYASHIPPGYSDEKKPEPERYGDLVIWQQTMAHAKEAKKHVLLVTGDLKEDWWLRVDGLTIGPRPELVAEMRATAGVRFYMYGLDGFMSEASERLAIETSEETIQEAKEISSDEFRHDVWTNLGDSSYQPHTVWSSIRAGSPVGEPLYTTSPRELWTGIYPTISQAKPETNVFVLGDEAVLTLRPRGALPANRKVVCMLATPSGTEARSVNGAAAKDTVAVRFPEDFTPLLEPQAGTYVAAWYDVPDDDDEPTLLASESFAMPDEL
jgi:hypothetical protein